MPVDQPLQALQKYFGYPNFRPGQKKIIDAILADHDTLAILPTGGGKSICFQIPGLVLDGITIVISPLISLMADQVQQLQNRKISACFINSSLSQAEIELRYQNMAQQKYKFIYLAPERLLTQPFLQICQQLPISFVAIDEAHCASMWGHDFRPHYQQIKKFIAQLPQKPKVAAFTATATPAVKQDMIKMLNLQKPRIFAQSFLRTNLQLNLLTCHTKAQKQVALIKILKNHLGQAGIIYCATRQATQQLAEELNCLNFQQQLSQQPISFYHGGLPAEQRQAIQNQFIKNQVKIICATNAFGMGVDKSDIRFVVHYQLSGNLENYYQEVGRAGRDQRPAHCYLLFHPPDIKIQLGFINKINNENYQQNKLTKLQIMVNFCSQPGCLTNKIKKYFSENSLIKKQQNCHNCSHCLDWHLQLSTQEKQVFSCLKNINQITWQTKYLISLLQPESKKNFLKIPGIGLGAYSTLEKLKLNW